MENEETKSNQDKIAEKMSNKPEWLEEPVEADKDGKYIWKAHLYGKTYEIEELVGKKIESAFAMAEKMGWSSDDILVQRSLQRSLNKEEQENLRGRIYTKLKTAVMHVYGFTDF